MRLTGAVTVVQSQMEVSAEIVTARRQAPLKVNARLKAIEDQLTARVEKIDRTEPRLAGKDLGTLF